MLGRSNVVKRFPINLTVQNKKRYNYIKVSLSFIFFLFYIIIYIFCWESLIYIIVSWRFLSRDSFCYLHKTKYIHINNNENDECKRFINIKWSLYDALHYCIIRISNLPEIKFLSKYVKFQRLNFDKVGT